MAAATTIMDKTLRDDFGFSNLMWVFSGRRGIHCWVCDDEARSMNNEMRAAVTEYCNLGVGNELTGKMHLSYPLHPTLKRAYEYLFPNKFEEIIIEE
jgi:DNA primase small subunit